MDGWNLLQLSGVLAAVIPGVAVFYFWQKLLDEREVHRQTKIQVRDAKQSLEIYRGRYTEEYHEKERYREIAAKREEKIREAESLAAVYKRQATANGTLRQCPAGHPLRQGAKHCGVCGAKAA